MQPRLNRLAVAALAVTGFLALSPRASADPIQPLSLQLTGSATTQVGVKMGSDPNTPISNVTPGPFHWSKTPVDPPNNNFPNTLTTFCIELTPDLQTPEVGDKFTFAVRPLGDPSTTINTEQKANDIKALFGKYYKSQWSEESFTGDELSRAFQLALWELIYDTDKSLTNSNGNFSSPSSVAGLADAMLGDLDGGLDAYNRADYELISLIAPVPGTVKPTDGQDQIAVRPKPVPAPPAALLAGFGVLALLGRARFNRRKPTAA